VVWPAGQTLRVRADDGAAHDRRQRCQAAPPRSCRVDGAALAERRRDAVASDVCTLQFGRVVSSPLRQGYRTTVRACRESPVMGVRKAPGLTIFALFAAATYGTACRTTCEVGIKFHPSVDAESRGAPRPDTASIYDDASPSKITCPGGGEYVDTPGTQFIIVACTSEWCATGYEGDYCVTYDEFDSWVDTNCAGCRVRCANVETVYFNGLAEECGTSCELK
jgi:hypothetical protein